MMLKIILMIIFSYLLGSVNTALTCTFLLEKADIRRFGDGNAGATNVFSNINRPIGVFVFIADFIKGGLSIYLCEQLGFSPEISAFVGSFVILGHNFPIFYGLKGGTGISSMIGGLVFIDVWIGLFALILSIIVILITNLTHHKLLGFSFFETGEIFGFVLLIFVSLLYHLIALKIYFFTSLVFVVLKHKNRVTKIFRLRSKHA